MRCSGPVSDWARLPAQAEGDGNQAGAATDGGHAQAIGGDCRSRRQNVEIADFRKQLHSSVVIDATEAVGIAAADVPAALVGREMTDNFVLRALEAFEELAEFGFFRISEAGDLAIKTAAAGDVYAVGGLGKQVHQGVEAQRQDVGGAAGGSGFRDHAAGELVIHELVLGKHREALVEVQAAADGEVATPGDVVRGISNRTVGAAASLKRQAVEQAVATTATTVFILRG